MAKSATNRETSSTADTYEARRPIPATTSFRVSVTTPRLPRNSEAIEAAVYSYIQALRALGKTQVNTAEIARALGLPMSNVEKALPKLTERGIRRAG